MSRCLSTFVCATMLAAAGCSSNPTTPDASFPVTMTLRVGDTRSIGGLNAKFVEVVDDWRCPITALCISAGDASLQLEFTTDGRFLSSRLQQFDPTLRVLTFDGYVIEVKDLLPARDPRVLMSQRDYTVMLEVRR